MRTTAITFLSLALLGGSSVALAEPLGEHPAVIVQRLYTKQGYDYASKFYPHPAWLYLHAEAPRPMMDHPAVIVAKRQKEGPSQTAATEGQSPDRIGHGRRTQAVSPWQELSRR
jgi:hypothetical protein